MVYSWDSSIYQDNSQNSPLVEEKQHKELRYQKIKQINKKYSRIVLVKQDTMKERLEMKKASHSLDIGVPSNGTIYKPDLRLKRLESWENSISHKFKKHQSALKNYNTSSIKINIKPGKERLIMPKIFNKGIIVLF